MQHTIYRFYMKPPVYVLFVEKGNEWSWFTGTDPGVANTATTKQWLLFFFAKMPLVVHTTL